MRYTINETKKKKTLKDIAVSIPSSLYSNKIFGKEVELENCYCSGSSNDLVLSEMWAQQHPLIIAWLILSSVSICFLFTLLFVIH